MRTLTYIIVALSFVCLAHASFGKKLIRSAGAQEPLPITINAASAAGWVKSDPTCIPEIGQAWNFEKPYPTNTHPITLYFAANGQISGFGTDVRGQVPDMWYLRGYYIYITDGQFRIRVATRSAEANLCNLETPFLEPIGDRIVINPDGINHRIPPNENDAAAKNWTRGGCLDGMGRHWQYDLVSAPNFSFNRTTFLPVVPMYDLKGNLNAVFFLSIGVQQGPVSNNQWDAGYVTGNMFCKNFCGTCGWSNYSWWSTMHIWFGTTSLKCPSWC